MKKLLFIVILALISASSQATICRNPAVKREFDRRNGYPKGRAGYVVDHICALANGGLDIVENMQYQTYLESKQKDKIENTALGRQLYCTKYNSLPYRTVYNCR